MKRTRLERVRLGLMLVGGMLFFAICVARLGQLQIVNAAQYSEIVDRQSSGTIPIPAERGMIYDRYGRMVAKSITRQSLSGRSWMNGLKGRPRVLAGEGAKA